MFDSDFISGTGTCYYLNAPIHSFTIGSLAAITRFIIRPLRYLLNMSFANHSSKTNRPSTATGEPFLMTSGLISIS
jgi:hypothetical protein